jgi:DNA-directed RNA polymerase II subunit RPB9
MGIQFCRECNNLMSPKIEDGLLLYTCGRCETISEPSSPIISTVSFKKRHDSNPSQKQHLIHDITLPRLSMRCPKCGNQECLSYMENSDERALNSYYVCTKCFFEWTD